jgi:hypothetical protein
MDGKFFSNTRGFIMKYIKFFVVIIGITISACSEADNVPTIKDMNNIVVDGVKMTKVEFFQKYCSGLVRGQKENETCAKVKLSVDTDFIKGTGQKDGW